MRLVFAAVPGKQVLRWLVFKVVPGTFLGLLSSGTIAKFNLYQWKVRADSTRWTNPTVIFADHHHRSPGHMGPHVILSG